MLLAQTTGDAIAAELRREILAGALPPGAPLRQEALAERFAISRIPVREALRSLERDGLVEVHPNRGAFVVRLSADDIAEITEMRALIEGDLIALATPLMDAADRVTIAKAAEAAAALSTTTEWNEADRRFHEALYRPAGRPRQLAMAMGLRREVGRYSAIYGQLPMRRKAWLADHMALVDACLGGEGEQARGILVDHIRRAGAFLTERLGGA